MTSSRTFRQALRLSLLALSSTFVAHSVGAQTPKTAAADAKYLQKNALGSVSDYATAQLAVQKAQSPALYRYGLMLLDDHARLNKMLSELAHQRHLSPPLVMEDKETQELQTLTAQSGGAFDKAAVAQFVKTNTEDVQDGLKELSTTKDPQIKRIVAEFVRVEKKHLAGAKALQAKMGM